MPKLATITFFGLNAVRALSIITLLLLFSSSIVTMAADIKAVNAFIAAGKDSNSSSNSTMSALNCTEDDCDYIEGSTVPNQPAGAFWAVLNRLLIIFQAIVLILSEIGWPAQFFDKFFPVLGKDFGLGALGVIQGLLGAAVLSHHVDEFSLVSAFFLFAVGCLNMLLGLIFRERAKAQRSIRAWRDGTKDVLPNPATATGAQIVTLPFNFTEPEWVSVDRDRRLQKREDTWYNNRGSLCPLTCRRRRQSLAQARLFLELITKHFEEDDVHVFTFFACRGLMTSSMIFPQGCPCIITVSSSFVAVVY
ncbi:unnamed protein product [Somion occarium]|uniref:DUF7598 domain-containing protein n=1 Tax=Somion occarium TaxID=3059160 RepID=A0ABP1CVY7_9APHY